MLKEYKNLANNRMLQGGNHGVHYLGAGLDREGVMDLAGAEVGEGLDDDDDEEEPPVCVFEANNLHKGSN